MPPGPGIRHAGSYDADSGACLPLAATTERNARPQIEKATAKAIIQTVRLRIFVFLQGGNEAAPRSGRGSIFNCRARHESRRPVLGMWRGRGPNHGPRRPFFFL